MLRLQSSISALRMSLLPPQSFGLKATLAARREWTRRSDTRSATPPLFERAAAASMHANRASSGVQLQKVMEMGFPEAEAREALDKFNGDENAAVNSLLGL